MSSTSGPASDMHHLYNDALAIQTVLPWIESEDKIISFFRTIPQKYENLRIRLALQYFIQLRDKDEQNSGLSIESDALAISELLPYTDRNRIQNHLKELGNVYNRKEIVIRQLLKEQTHLNPLINSLISNVPELKLSNGNVFHKRKRPIETHVLDNTTVNEEQTSPFKTMKVEKDEIKEDQLPPLYPSSAINNVDVEGQPKGFSNLLKVHHCEEIAPAVPTKFGLPSRLNFQNGEEVPAMPSKFGQPPQLNYPKYERFPSASEQSEPPAPLNFQNREELPSVLVKREPPTRLNFQDREEIPSVSLKSESAVSFVNYEEANSLSVKFEPAARSNFSKSKEVPAVPPEFMDVISLVSESNIMEDMLEPNPVEINLCESVPTVDITSEPREKYYDESLIIRLKEIFPQACPDYIRNLCQGKQWSEFDNLVTELLSNEYPQRPERVPSPPKEIDLDEQLKIVKELLPDADPTYLSYKCEKIGNDVEALNAFINEARELKNYPTMKEYLRKQKFTAQIKQYTTEFNVENFVALFPNPDETFKDPNRIVEVDYRSEAYVSYFFQLRYDRIPLKVIRAALVETKFNILASDEILKSKFKMGATLKSRRKTVRHQNPPQNILLLQNLAYLTHKEEIEQYIKEAKEKEEAERKNAKENSLFNECKCCYDNEVMPKDSFSCPNGCVFCKSCIKKSCEISFGEGKTEMMCLNGCPIEFTLHTLQLVLPPKLFSKLAQKKALAEVRAAGIDELESCPFCDFASIPNAEDKIFRCLNPDCMKESCRSCKEENHVPYKCDEIEKDDDVKARIFVENQMTEALLRKCYKCGKSFYKEEGCNKMTCICGATMCYVCKQPVKDYKHFNGLGGDRFERCPLYSDSNEINRTNVLQAAEAAKSKVDPNKLKIDPTLDIKKHYEQRKKALPAEPHLRYVGQVPPIMELVHILEQHGHRLPQLHRHPPGQL
ncbi:unnamed protein product [Diabrotica balteata]|uniref:RING-type domain-containing protein n=1 Tax=Diabrotica balteata TaxID=107213 RepID=A0A9N9X740_DIABA|nr:unnamed protein product [Diabrotica balteata]